MGQDVKYEWPIYNVFDEVKNLTVFFLLVSIMLKLLISSLFVVMVFMMLI